jgi:hypothetical protein
LKIVHIENPFDLGEEPSEQPEVAAGHPDQPEDIQLREGRWVIIDLRAKGGRIRTVAVPIWVKQGINAWMIAAKIEEGPLLRPSMAR